MKSAWMLSTMTIFSPCLRARGVRALFAPTCRYAAVVLGRLALVALMALAFGSTASAQTAHLSNAQSILNSPGSLDYPQGVAVDGNGNIFVADAYNKRVLELTPSSSGGFTQSTVGTGLGIPYGVAVDTSGNIYIADITLTTLLKETPSASGYIQSTIGSGLYDATSVAVDPQGNVYGVEINNSFIGTLFKETLSEGTYTQSFIPVPGSHGVFSVAVDGNGNLFLDDGWDGRVFEQSPIRGGGFTTTELSGAAGAVAVDGNNDVYIASYPGYIDKLTPSGSGYTTSYIPTNATNTPYGYFDAGGLAVDMNGNIYFTDLYTYSLIEEAISGGNFGLANVNSPSPSLVSMFFTFDTAGAIGFPSVNTQGAVPFDFFDAGTGDCYATESFGIGESCWIDVTFTPTAAGLRSGAAELLDGNGNPFATGYVQGTGVAPLVNFGPGTPITENILSDGSAVAADTTGALYTVAPGSSTAFKDTPGAGPSGWTEVPIGSGLSSATGIAIDGGGDLYIADQTNREIVKETLTSTGYSQSVIANQSNGLNEPAGVAVDESGSVYVSDLGNNAVYKETLTAGGYAQSVVPASALNQPNGVAVDSIGAVYIADTNNNRVLKETPSGGGYVESTIGSGLSSPTAVAVDAFGNVYISETGAGEVFKETLAASSYLQSTLISGIQPYGLAVDSNLNLYIAGSNSQLLVKLDVADAPTLNFAATGIGQVSSDSPKAITLSNAGNAPLTLPVIAGQNNPYIAAGYLLDTSVANDCPVVSPNSVAPSTLATGTSCLLSISFSPLAAGPDLGNLTIFDNNLNASAPNYSSQTITLLGAGAVIQSQTINFPGIAAQNIGATLNLSATASSGLTVSFSSTTPATCTVIGSTASLIAGGTCTIQASQAGDNQYSAAPNVSQSFMVNSATQTINFPVIATQTAGTSLNLSATATSNLAVSFASTTPAICTISNGTASLIAGGTCTIQASQAGDNQYSAAPNVNQSFMVNSQTQTINFAGIAAQTLGTMLNLSASATSGLAVSFASTTPAVCTVTGSTASLIAAGVCTIQASQAGNNQFSAAPNVNQSFMVNAPSQQTINFPAIAAQTAGTTLNLSATATSGLAVSFASTTPAICTVTGSTASLIAAGNCNIEASQSGSVQYAAAQDVNRNFNVKAAAQTISFAAIAAQSIGAKLNLSATASSGLAVNFSSTTPATCTVAGGMASMIAAGPCTIQASQPGNNEYSAAPNVSQSFMVNAQAQQTITFAAIAAQNVGTTLNLSATASSGLAVSFSSTTPAICTVSGGAASLIAGGNCIIEASQTGNGQYAAAPNVFRLFAVNLFPQTITFAAIAGQNVGATLNLSATASSGLPVSFLSGLHAVCTVSGNTVSIIAPGNCIIEASQAGNGHYAAAPNVIRIFAVSLDPQSITFAAIAAQNIGATLNLSATASSGLAVSFSSTTPAICTVTGNLASMIAPGGCNIEASQPGNNQYAAAPNVNRIFGVKLFPQTITFAAIGAQNIGATLNLSATASSGLAVSFSSTTPAICTVTGNSASMIAPGNCTIEASQPGNGHYAAAPNVSRTFAVNLLSQTINFAVIAAQNIGTMLNLSATASSGLAVSFASTTPAVCTVSGNSASLNALGNCIIRASQAGNGHYAAAPNVNRIFKVNP
jgi:streptogramin lyase